MATKKAGTVAGKSTALAPMQVQALTPKAEAALARVVGSEVAVAKIAGTGGEVVRQGGIVRVSGRDYRTSGGTAQAAQIYFVDGTTTRDGGPALGEADKVSRVAPVTSYECIMLRDNPDGYLSGYVGVPADHPMFGWQHEAVPVELGIEVHGGLTYSRICDEGPSPERSLIVEVRRICHVVVGHTPLRHATDHRVHAGQWWFGFDCNHLYDVVPGRPRDRARFMGSETSADYRDDGYVVREIRNLAAQLRAIADGRPAPARVGPPLPAIGLDPQRGG